MLNIFTYFIEKLLLPLLIGAFIFALNAYNQKLKSYKQDQKEAKLFFLKVRSLIYRFEKWLNYYEDSIVENKLIFNGRTNLLSFDDVGLKHFSDYTSERVIGYCVYNRSGNEDYLFEQYFSMVYWYNSMTYFDNQNANIRDLNNMLNNLKDHLFEAKTQRIIEWEKDDVLGRLIRAFYNLPPIIEGSHQPLRIEYSLLIQIYVKPFSEILISAPNIKNKWEQYKIVKLLPEVLLNLSNQCIKIISCKEHNLSIIEAYNITNCRTGYKSLVSSIKHMNNSPFKNIWE